MDACKWIHMTHALLVVGIPVKGWLLVLKLETSFSLTLAKLAAGA